MKSSKLILAAAFCMVAVSLSCAAQDKGYWRAASTNAAAITGDIAFLANAISLSEIGFPSAEIRKLTPTEVAAVFDADVNAGRNGTLYRTNIPAGQRFLHRNTLCGTEDTQWVATYVTGKTIEVAFFSGSDEPKFTFDALVNSPDKCGLFTYAR